MSERATRAAAAFCPDCGSFLAVGHAVCPGCGNQLAADGSARTFFSNTAPAGFAAEDIAAAVRAEDAPSAAAEYVGLVDTPATFGRRVAARVIDGLVVALLAIVVWIAAVGVANAAAGSSAVPHVLVTGLLFALLVPPLSAVVFRIASDAVQGRSLGRAAVGIRLVRVVAELGPDVDPTTGSAPTVERRRVGFGRAAWRFMVGGLGDCLFGLSSLSVLWDKEKRSWADRAAGTAVIVDRADRRARGVFLPPAMAAAASCVVCLAVSGALTAAEGTYTLSSAGDVRPSPISTPYSYSGYSNYSSTQAYTGPSASPTESPDYTTPSYVTPAYVTPSPSASDPYGFGTSTPEPTPSAYSGGSYPAKDNLVVRSGPDVDSPQVGTISAGDFVTIECQTEGSYVVGPNGASSIWDRISSPSYGYVSDDYVATGTTGTNATITDSC